MNATSAGPGALDPDFAQLKAYLIERSGLTYYAERDDDLLRRVTRRLEVLGIDTLEAYLALLRRSAEETDAMIAELTIGETYFFREPEQLDALRTIVLPDLLERNIASRRLRVWSAGCSTGAEPYSLAILLAREPALAGWDVSILGTDINRQSLSRAEEARFGAWELRTTEKDAIDRCFIASDKTWTLRPDLRRGVTFQYHNLVQHPFPSFAAGLFGFDVILCRNVLMYFDRSTAARLIEQFHRTLAERGWLLVGHAETGIDIPPDLRTVLTAGATLYQKGPLDAPAAPPEDSVWAQILGHNAARAAGGFGAPDLPGPEPPRPPDRLRPSAPPSVPAAPAVERDEGLDEVRRLGDQGRLQDALHACDRLLERRGLDVGLHFHRALVLEQLGRTVQAEQALRQTLYLDRRFALAHFHLALLRQRRHDVVGARRSFENAMQILRGLRPEQAVTRGDPLTVADLRAMTLMQLGVLEAQ
jgi:chemotaxis protein methyltransferase CheR